MPPWPQFLHSAVAHEVAELLSHGIDSTLNLHLSRSPTTVLVVVGDSQSLLAADLAGGPDRPAKYTAPVRWIGDPAAIDQRPHAREVSRP